MKFHLKRVVGSQVLTYEELETVSCQVEACLNSRPILATTSHDSDGIFTLTAGHFLILKPPAAYPEDPRLPEEPCRLLMPVHRPALLGQVESRVPPNSAVPEQMEDSQSQPPRRRHCSPQRGQNILLPLALGKGPPHLPWQGWPCQGSSDPDRDLNFQETSDKAGSPPQGRSKDSSAGLPPGVCLGTDPIHCPQDDLAPQLNSEEQDPSIGEMPEALTSQGGGLT